MDRLDVLADRWRNSSSLKDRRARGKAERCERQTRCAFELRRFPAAGVVSGSRGCTRIVQLTVNGCHHKSAVQRTN